MTADLPENRVQPGEQADILVLGGGPSGLTAALYAARARMKTIVLEKQTPGGQMLLTSDIENYPGFDHVLGYQLVDKMVDQVTRFGAEIRLAEVRRVVHNAPKSFTVETSEGLFHGKSVIVATGRQARQVGIDGEARLTGRGVSYCATCDGAFYKGRKVAVVGGGDSAVEEGLFLTRFATEVSIVHRRDRLRAAKYLQERAFSNGRISFVWDHVPVSVLGKEGVEGLVIRHVSTGEERTLGVEGVFIFVGFTPNTSFLKGFVKMAEDGSIVTSDRMATDVPGVFACGDVRSRPLYQIATAVGDGAEAGVAAEKFIEGVR